MLCGQDPNATLAGYFALVMCEWVCNLAQAATYATGYEEKGGAMGLDPAFPVVSGAYDVTEDWAIDLPWSFNRRFEDESLVLWRPGVTIWIDHWDGDEESSLAQRLVEAKQDLTRGAYDVLSHHDGRMARLIYRLPEEAAANQDHALYTKLMCHDSELFISVAYAPEISTDDLKALVESVHLRK